MKIKKILVPIDYSDCSVNALQYAAELANYFEANMMLLHALDSWHINEELIKKLKDGHYQNLSNEIANITALANKMTDIVISEKSPQKAIAEAVELYDVDLVVMGTLGADDLFDKVMGSLTYNIMVNSNVPVLAIPNEYRFYPYDKIGLAVDYKEVMQPEAINLLKEFAFAFQSKLEVFHIEQANQPEEVLAHYEESKLDVFFGDIEHVYKKTTSTRSIDKALENYLTMNQPDLLVMLPRKHGFLERLTQKSTSRWALHTLKIPVLAIAEN